MSAQHPLYMGFMGTVGVGFALLVYWIGSNTTQLLLWIITALFITLGLDPVVRWLERRNVPRAAGILLSVSTLALWSRRIFRHPDPHDRAAGDADRAAGAQVGPGVH